MKWSKIKLRKVSKGLTASEDLPPDRSSGPAVLRENARDAVLMLLLTEGERQFCKDQANGEGLSLTNWMRRRFGLLFDK